MHAHVHVRKLTRGLPGSLATTRPRRDMIRDMIHVYTRLSFPAWEAGPGATAGGLAWQWHRGQPRAGTLSGGGAAPPAVPFRPNRPSTLGSYI